MHMQICDTETLISVHIQNCVLLLAFFTLLILIRFLLLKIGRKSFCCVTGKQDGWVNEVSTCPGSFLRL